MERHQCSRCGADLRHEGGKYRCIYCRAEYEDDFEQKAAYTLQTMLEAAKIEKLSAARRVLYDAAHARYPSKDAVLSAARNVLAIYPDDVLAKVYALSHDTDPYDLASLLPTLSLPKAEADEVVNWLIPSLHPRLVGPLQDFTMRHYKNEERTRYLTALENEAAKLQEGIYEAGLARDVFLCYSSADMPKVVHILDLLEENGFQCFAAFRNLRHGKGSADNYLSEIKKAMGACTVFLFLSSNCSRSATCDALRVEMPILLENHPNKPRIEYILEDYGSHVPLLVKATLKKVFPEQEHCRDEEDLVMRVNDLLHAHAATAAPKARQPEPQPSIKKAPEPVYEEPEPEEPSLDDFVIEKINGQPTLRKYKGRGGHVVLPRGITQIYTDAFAGSDIESFESTEDLALIYGGAFSNCRKLKTVTIVPNPSGVKMGGFPFLGCTIDRLTLPVSSLPSDSSGSALSKAVIGTLVLTSNGTPAIRDIVPDFACFSTTINSNIVTIREIILEDGIESIGDCAFADIHGLKSIKMTGSVTHVGRQALRSSDYLDEAVISAHLLEYENCRATILYAKNVTVTGKGRFSGFGGVLVESVVFDADIEEFPQDAFSGCRNLTKLVLPKSLRRIYCRAFANCTSLTDLYLPDGIVEVREDLFQGTSMRVHITNKELKRVLKDGYAFRNSKAKLIIDR